MNNEGNSTFRLTDFNFNFQDVFFDCYVSDELNKLIAQLWSILESNHYTNYSSKLELTIIHIRMFAIAGILL